MKSIKLLKTSSSQKLKSHMLEFNKAPKLKVFQIQTLRCTTDMMWKFWPLRISLSGYSKVTLKFGKWKEKLSNSKPSLNSKAKITLHGIS